MQQDINSFIIDTIRDLIDDSSKYEKLQSIFRKHMDKTHFIPIKYRVLAGILQSMNIKFGNFIEELLGRIIQNENKLILHRLSGERNARLYISEDSQNLLDKYITSRQTVCSDGNLLDKFYSCIDECLEIEKRPHIKTMEFINDVDILFSIRDKNSFYYLEIKYNDDHDTGKFIDINRKFIKTYIGLSNTIQIYDIDKFKPILYYLIPTRKKGNIYIPEPEHIYRGERLFNEFFSNISYQDLDKALNNIGNSREVIKLFDVLYGKIMNQTF